MENESLKILRNLIDEKYKTVVSRVNDLIATIGELDLESKIKKADELLTTLQELSNTLAAPDRPGWLNKLYAYTREYREKAKTTRASWRFLNSIMPIYYEATNHNWRFNSGNDNAGFNFDDIYHKYRQSSRVTELFEKMLSILQEMVESKEIDSLKAITALKKLISTLSKNKNGSYFSTLATFDFAKSFVKNLLWEQFSNLSVIKPLKKAYEKTVKDAGLEIDKLNEEIKKELTSKFETTDELSLGYYDKKSIEQERKR